MKYIMFEDFSGTPMPIIFPHRINHEEMRDEMPYSKVLSAGYVTLGPNGFSCHGKSKALRTEAAQGDAQIIAQKFEDPES